METVLEALTALCAHPECHVMIVSGLPQEKVLEAFGSVPNLSLAVEHGFNFRVGNGPWQQLAGRAVSLAVEQVEPHARPLVRDAQRGEGAAPLLDSVLEGEVRVELLRDLSSEDGAAAALTTSEPDKGGAPRVCA